MDEPTYTDANRRQTLLIVRIIWLALIVGQLSFGTAMIFNVHRGEAGGESQLGGQMLAIATGVLIGAIGIGYFVRNQSYKKHWREHAVTPPGFFQGNLILLGALEGASFVTLVFVMVTGQLFPMILPAVISLAVQFANYPRGTPMHTAMPDFTQNAR